MADLAEEGVEVTQATVSRDLAALGAVRAAGGYRLPDDPTPGVGGESLSRALRAHAVGFDLAATLVVVRTAPGHAPALASEIDRARPTGMVGCIAGDDTIFVATPSSAEARGLLAVLSGEGGAR